MFYHKKTPVTIAVTGANQLLPYITCVSHKVEIISNQAYGYSGNARSAGITPWP